MRLTNLLCLVIGAALIDANPMDGSPFDHNLQPKPEALEPRMLVPLPGGRKAPPADLGPYPRTAYCSLPADSEVPQMDQDLWTNKVCQSVLRKCRNTKDRGFSCPTAKNFYNPERKSGGPKNRYTSQRCTLINMKMQSWFDSECKKGKPKGYSCKRRVMISGGSENDIIDVACRDALRGVM